MKTILLTVIVLSFTLQSGGCGGGEKSPSSATNTCPKHSDHRIADPHSHNALRARLGYPPTEWATRVIAEEEAAYKKCVQNGGVQ